MRKLKQEVQMTIDGFVGGPNGELDWLWIGKLDEAILQRIVELANTCDTLLLGRKMLTDSGQRPSHTHPGSYPLVTKTRNDNAHTPTQTHN